MTWDSETNKQGKGGGGTKQKTEEGENKFKTQRKELLSFLSLGAPARACAFCFLFFLKQVYKAPGAQKGVPRREAIGKTTMEQKRPFSSSLSSGAEVRGREKRGQELSLSLSPLLHRLFLALAPGTLLGVILP